MTRRFFLKLGLYLLPVGLYAAITVGAPFYVGEFMPLNQVVAMQSGDEPVLYGPAFTENEYTYKLLTAERRQPEVLVVGSSRSMEFRAAFFNKAHSVFYNAAGVGRSLSQVSQFLAFLDGNNKPNVMIVEVTQSLLVSTVPLNERNPLAEGELYVDFTHVLNTSKNMLISLLNQKILPSQLYSRREPFYGGWALGYNASIKGSGFRNDGSRRFGSDWPVDTWSLDSRIEKSLQSLKDGDGQFRPGDTLDESSLRDLATMLQDCKDRGIYVIGYTPAFAPSIYQAMIADGKHDYLLQIKARLQPLFEQYGFAFFDFSDAMAFGVTDDDMLDGYHPSEWVTLLCYIEMVKALPDVLGPYSDLAYLEQIASEATNPFEVFGE